MIYNVFGNTQHFYECLRWQNTEQIICIVTKRNKVPRPTQHTILMRGHAEEYYFAFHYVQCKRVFARFVSWKC